jgi:FkbM family methyltransferase
VQDNRSVRVAAYVQAPPGQVGHPELGLAPQRERIERFVAERGWELVELYEEEPGAGARPALARLEGELTGLDRVVVVRLDRLRRSVDDVLRFVRRLGAAEVGLVCLDEALDTRDVSGQSLERVLEQVARWQRVAEARAGWRPESLRKPGFAPATLIDVGVGPGTGDLYQAFPDAYLVLVEPLAEFEPMLRELVGRRPGEYVLTAVGSSNGSAELNVDHDSLIASSLLPTVVEPGHAREARAVPMTTLDALLDERGWTPPFGLKIDVEGFEDHVVEGAASLLEDTQFVLAEVSVTRRFEGSYTFAEFVASMQARGFRLCDVLHVARNRPDRDVQYMDALFRRGD